MKSPRDQEIFSWWGWRQYHFFHYETTRLSRGGDGDREILFPQKFKLKEIHETK